MDNKGTDKNGTDLRVFIGTPPYSKWVSGSLPKPEY